MVEKEPLWSRQAQVPREDAHKALTSWADETLLAMTNGKLVDTEMSNLLQQLGKKGGWKISNYYDSSRVGDALLTMKIGKEAKIILAPIYHWYHSNLIVSCATVTVEVGDKVLDRIIQFDVSR